MLQIAAQLRRKVGLSQKGGREVCVRGAKGLIGNIEFNIGVIKKYGWA